MQLKQFVPPEYCLKCDVCCRLLDEESSFAANIFLISYKDRFICSNFDPTRNKCKDYKNRPLDCYLYPFVIMWDENYRYVLLGIDHKCHYVENHLDGKSIWAEFKNWLLANLKDIDPRYILRFQKDIEILGKLDIEIEPVLNRLLIGDKILFEKYANQTDKPFSTNSFVANYIWTDLLDYYWTIRDDNFCLFCKTHDTIFMPIPPFTPPGCKAVVNECFKIMERLNKNKDTSRIEDISEEGMKFFNDSGYIIKEKGNEYIYNQKELVNLSGNKYKEKRALCNYFVRNYKFEYREFENEDEEDCLMLFQKWKGERIKRYKDDYYKALLEDSYFAHKKAMSRYEDLGLIGRVVAIENKISSYTFGYPLNQEVFVILFEVADLRIKGLSQFIFREFCKESDKFKYINLMDDSGLANLRKVKLSYHPVKIEKTFCAYG